MFDPGGQRLGVRIDATSAELLALATQQPFACGRLLGPVRRAVLLRGDHAPGTEIEIDAGSCVPLPPCEEVEDILLIAPTAALLAAWRTLNLELGDAAVWTGDSNLSRLAGHLALSGGACPGIQLAGCLSTGPRRGDFEVVDWDDPEQAMSALARIVSGRPGFAALELTGRAEVIDILLEIIPRWGRLFLAGPAGQPVTLDFYKNIHRKGVVLSSETLDVSRVFDARLGPRLHEEMIRAARLLATPTTREFCRTLFTRRRIGAVVPTPA